MPKDGSIRKTRSQDLAAELSSSERKALEIREEVDRKSQSFTAEMQRFSQRYEEEEEQRRKAAKDLIERIETETSKALIAQHSAFDVLETDSLSRVNLLAANLENSAAMTIAKLESDKAAAQKLLGIVGETGLIRGCKKRQTAREQRLGCGEL